MPSRRDAIRGMGAAVGVGFAGCMTAERTTGIVGRKQIMVDVPRDVGDPVTASPAVLTVQSEQRVTGEYADIVSEVVDGASISVSDAAHDRLAKRFASVNYYANIVPENGSDPASGLLSRVEFNDLTTGGTATVGSTMKTEDGGSSVRHLEVRDVSSPATPSTEFIVSQYDWEDRIDETGADG